MKTIALVMIARDEARCIARCLASLRPWVDAMVVLDTGSVDDTPCLARAAGADVHRFDWVDDFAAARNAALALSPADWNLVIDADEWLESGGAALAAVRDAEASFVGLVQVRSEFDDAGRLGQAPSWLPRLLPRGVRYEGRVHEQPRHALERRRLEVRIGHDGYLQSQLDRKRGRNRALLQRAVDEQPHDPYLRYQLGKDLEVEGCFAQAIPHYQRAYAEGDPRAAWRHDLVLRLLYSLKRVRDFETAFRLAEMELPRWPHSADYFFTLGDLLLDWAAAEPSRAGELLPMIEQSWLRCLELGDTLDLEGAVAGRGSHLAAHNLSVLYQGLGDEARANSYRFRSARPHASAPG